MMATAPATDPISFREFLEGVPPGTSSVIGDLGGAATRHNDGTYSTQLNCPEITLYCNTKTTCDGNRLFKTSANNMFTNKESKLIFVTYRCKNCSKEAKTFALWIMIDDDLKSGRALKYGEQPAFGPPTPARVISLIGP